jgi:hypothetical protein
MTYNIELDLKYFVSNEFDSLTGLAAFTSTPHSSRKRDPLEAALNDAPTSPAKSYRS